jgi:hypothetical protein
MISHRPPLSRLPSGCDGDGEIKDPATLKQGRCRVGIEVLQGGLLLEDGRVLWEEQAEAGGGA